MINDDLIGTVTIAQKNCSYITVVGVGGAGGNAAEYMYNLGIADVEFLVCNTDLQALNQKPIRQRVALGTNLTGGLGAGASPEIGEKAAIESEIDIRNALEACETKMAFITAGMGGGTGTGAAPVIARIARDMGILTVGIVTMPLLAEARTERAMAGLDEMKKQVDAILVIDNEAVFNIYGDSTFQEAFGKANEILATAAKSIADIIIKEYHMNIDFADVKKTIANKGVVLMGTHTAKTTSEDIIEELVRESLSSPLLMQNNISGATNLLVSITWGGKGLSAGKVNQILHAAQQAAGGRAELISGIGDDKTLAEDEVKLTIIATGFDKSKSVYKHGLATGEIADNDEEEMEEEAQQEEAEMPTLDALFGTPKIKKVRKAATGKSNSASPLQNDLFADSYNKPKTTIYKPQQPDRTGGYGGESRTLSKSDYSKFALKWNVDDMENVPAYVRRRANISHKIDPDKKVNKKLENI